MECHHVLVEGSRVRVAYLRTVHPNVGRVDPVRARVSGGSLANAVPNACEHVGHPQDAREEVEHAEAQPVAFREIEVREFFQDPHDPEHPHHAHNPQSATELREAQHLQAAAAVRRQAVGRLGQDDADPVASHDACVGPKPSAEVGSADHAEVLDQLAAAVKPGEKVDTDVARPEDRRHPRAHVERPSELHVPGEHVRKQGEVVHQDQQAEHAEDHVEATVRVDHTTPCEPSRFRPLLPRRHNRLDGGGAMRALGRERRHLLVERRAHQAASRAHGYRRDVEGRQDIHARPQHSRPTQRQRGGHERQF
mmetsp:Transcript_6973/g.19732  ORF Transcript_6973/g.19732 Transcript_6973/m.19732 type:complete len:308 (-) Transcript_6973:563-1486(-)